MNTLDLIISAIVLLSLWRGFSVGFIKSFINLIGWLVALLAASRFAGEASVVFASVVSSPKLQLALGFLLVVLVTITLLTLISMIVNKLMESLHLKIIDRFAGGVLGAFKGILVILIVMSVSSPLLQKLPFWKNSILVPELMPFAPVAMQLSKDVFARSVQEITQSSNTDDAATVTPEKSSSQPDDLQTIESENDGAFDAN